MPCWGGVAAKGMGHCRGYRGVCSVSAGNQVAPRLQERGEEELESTGVVDLWIDLMMGQMAALGENRL